MKSRFHVLIILFLLSIGSSAKSSNSDWVNKRPNKDLEMKNLSITITIHGNLAETSMRLTVHNPTKEAISTKDYFTAPTTAYNSKINGKKCQLNFAKSKAKVESGNTTPDITIPAETTKHVSITYVSELKSNPLSGTYTLPLNFQNSINNLNLKVFCKNSLIKPYINIRNVTELDATRTNHGFKASYQKKDIQLDTSIDIEIPFVDQNQTLVAEKNGQSFFYLHDSFEQPNKEILTDLNKRVRSSQTGQLQSEATLPTSLDKSLKIQRVEYDCLEVNGLRVNTDDISSGAFSLAGQLTSKEATVVVYFGTPDKYLFKRQYLIRNRPNADVSMVGSYSSIKNMTRSLSLVVAISEQH